MNYKLGVELRGVQRFLFDRPGVSFIIQKEYIDFLFKHKPKLQLEAIAL